MAENYGCSLKAGVHLRSESELNVESTREIASPVYTLLRILS